MIMTVWCRDCCSICSLGDAVSSRQPPAASVRRRHRHRRSLDFDASTQLPRRHPVGHRRYVQFAELTFAGVAVTSGTVHSETTIFTSIFYILCRRNRRTLQPLDTFSGFKYAKSAFAAEPRERVWWLQMSFFPS